MADELPVPREGADDVSFGEGRGSAGRTERVVLDSSVRRFKIRRVEGAAMLVEAQPGPAVRRPDVYRRIGRFGFRGAELEPYPEFKAMLTEAVSVITSEVRREHALTRQEVNLSRKEVIDHIKASPSQYVQLVSEVGIVLCIFAILVHQILSVELINTAFALFMIFSFAVYWVMGWTKARKTKSDGPEAP